MPGEARCLQSLGSLHIAEQRHDDAVKLCEAALAAHRASGDQTGIAQCLHSIAWVAIERDQLDEAERHLRECLDLVAESDDFHTVGRFNLSLGALCIRRKRYAEASDHFLTSADLWRECGYQSGLAEVMADLGAIAVVTGDLARAASYLLMSTRLYRTLGVLHRSPELIEAAGGLSIARGDLDSARRWLNTSTAYRVANDIRPWSPWACHLRQWLRAAYPGDVPDQTRCPSMTDAFDEVWQYLGSLPPADAMRSQEPRLSRREQQVLRLIAAGHSDQAIADQLFISRRTASRHVSSILRKLGLESRTAAAVQAIRDGLISV